MSKCHEKDCHKKRSCWCGIVLVLLGGLILLGLVALIFHFKEPKEPEQQPNSTFYPFGEETLILTIDDPSFVVYENAEPQPILASFYDVMAEDGNCELLVTMENENEPDLTRTLKAGFLNPLNRIATLVSKEATKVTVDASGFEGSSECSVTIFGTNGTNFSSF